MKIYIAHNFTSKDILRDTIRELKTLGHECISTWIIDDLHILEKNIQESALKDLEDIDRADALLFFTDQYEPIPGRGKFIELGYALGSGRDNSCIFYLLPQITRINSLDSLNIR